MPGTYIYKSTSPRSYLPSLYSSRQQTHSLPSSHCTGHLLQDLTLMPGANVMELESFSQYIPGPQQILKAITSATLPFLSSKTPNYTPEQFLSCPKPELSCQTKFESQDTCCFNYPGGHFLQTQFWDADPAVGPDDSWTIHGLWYVGRKHPP